MAKAEKTKPKKPKQRKQIEGESEQQRIERMREDAEARARANDIYQDPEQPGFYGGVAGAREKFLAHYKDGSIVEQWLRVPPEDKRCTKMMSPTSVYRNQRCRKYRLTGVAVCMSHGGSFSSTRRSAQKRLIAASELAGYELVAMATDREVEPGTRVKALLAILDRAGVDGKQTLTIEVKPWQEALESIASGKSKKGKGRKQKELEA